MKRLSITTRSYAAILALEQIYRSLGYAPNTSIVNTAARTQSPLGPHSGKPGARETYQIEVQANNLKLPADIARRLWKYHDDIAVTFKEAPC